MSFIVPFHDVLVGQLLECIDSILVQGLDKYEILLIDDGSTNQELIEKCKAMSKSNKNIKYLRQDNFGAAVARNSGLDRADGDWVVFVDADDKLKKTFFSIISQYLVSDNELIIFDYDLWDRKVYERKTLSKGLKLERDREDILANIMFYPGKMDDFMFGSIWAKCFSRKFLEKNSLRFAGQLRKAQDRRFMVDVFRVVSKVEYKPVSMYDYHMNDGSITHKLDWSMEKYYRRLSKSFERFCDVNKIEPWISKFLNYSIFLELLPLTAYHIDADLSYAKRRKFCRKVYNSFNIKDGVSKIYYRDIPSLKGKIKLMFVKRRWFWLIWKMFEMRQNKERRKAFGMEKVC